MHTYNVFILPRILYIHTMYSYCKEYYTHAMYSKYQEYYANILDTIDIVCGYIDIVCGCMCVPHTKSNPWHSSTFMLTTNT
jgi:hypothetical protein